MAIPITSSITAIPVEQDLRRKPNFTEAEKYFLIHQYERYKPILSSKLCDSSISRYKHEIWYRITEELNSRNPNVQRTVKDVKKKWENLAAQSRKELIDYRLKQGAPFVAPPSAMALKILELIDEIALQRNDVPLNPTNGDDAGLVAATVDKYIKQECIVEDNQSMSSTAHGGEMRELDSSAILENGKAELLNRFSDDDPTVRFDSPVSSTYASSNSSNKSSGEKSLERCASARDSHECEQIYITTSDQVRKRPYEPELCHDTQTAHCDKVWSPSCCCCRDQGKNGKACLKKLKRLKAHLETEKLALENQKLKLEIQLLSQQLNKH